MSWLDALLGNVYSDGVPVDLAGGLDFREGLTARLNAETNRVEVVVDGSLAELVEYDNSGSGLASTTVQGAIDELASGAGGAPSLESVLAVGNATGAHDVDVASGQSIDFQGEVSVQRQGATHLSSASGAAFIGPNGGYVGIGVGESLPGSGKLRLPAEAMIRWTGGAHIQPVGGGLHLRGASTDVGITFAAGTADTRVYAELLRFGDMIGFAVGNSQDATDVALIGLPQSSGDLPGLHTWVCAGAGAGTGVHGDAGVKWVDDLTWRVRIDGETGHVDVGDVDDGVLIETFSDRIVHSARLEQAEFVDLEEVVEPSSPAAGKLRLYATTGHALAIVDSDGIVTVL